MRPTSTLSVEEEENITSLGDTMTIRASIIGYHVDERLSTSFYYKKCRSIQYELSLSPCEEDRGRRLHAQE